MIWSNSSALKSTLNTTAVFILFIFKETNPNILS